MVLRDQKDPLNTSRGIMGPLENSAGVQNNRGRLKQRFDLIRKLGQGTYGKVQLGIDKETGQEVAIKTIKKSKIETEADLIRIRREIQIMSSVRHPNIIHIYEVFENREKMVLVMEYAAGGELYDYLNERKILQEDEARRIFRQIASAVYYCHKNKICHRDLKLENILLDEKSNAKIADFGLSNVFDDVNMLKTFCGSPLYASPEIVKGTPYSGPEVDCWSLGVLLYTLVYGAMPFDGSNFKRLVKQISAGDYYEPKKPAEASTLIRIMLTVDPKKRAKVEDICSHGWINQGFDNDCLRSAEDLAKQTPVRLDVLLTLAPNMNHSPQGAKENSAQGQGQSNHKNENESDSALNEPPKKPKLHSDAASSGHKEGVPAPPKPKRKTQSKSKSKTTPLMLDLIQDVVEEENEDVEMCPSPQAQQAQQQPVAGTSVKAKVINTQPDKIKTLAQTQENDDECDTLSEISEIQTLAEDLESKPKERVKSVKAKKEKVADVATAITSTAQDHDSRAKGTKQTATTNTTSTATPKSQKTELIPPTAEPTKKVVPSEKVKETSVTPTPPEIPPSPTPTSTPETTKPAVVKKKVTKPKVPLSQDAETKTPEPPKKVTDEKVEIPKAPENEEKTSKPMPKQHPAPAASPERQKQATSSGSDEKSSDNEKSPNHKKLERQRSGSVSDVSPTRVERRNSKVISQKTAELIQNLETKTSTSGSGGSKESSGESKPSPVKKLVIPNFKVSDNKNKFETKPPRPITSSVMSQSKAAFEAKAQQAQTPTTPPIKPSTPSVVEKSPEKDKPKAKEAIAPPPPTPSKAKSPSPIPNKNKEECVTPTSDNRTPQQDKLTPPEKKESPAAVSPKTKPKVVKKLGGESKPAVKAVTPEPPSISEATVTTTTSTRPVVSTEALEPQVEKAKAVKPGKIQIPPGLTQQSINNVKPEVKPVMVDAGKGGPKPAAMVVGKGQPQPTTPLSPPLSKLVPQNKEQAAKKISSVITKIVTSSSGSGDETNKKLTTPITHKTEVSFPVAAAPSQERVIPIKFEPEEQPGTPLTAASSSNGKNKFPPRFDSFKRFDSASSIYSRQNSSDTESCSIAPPKPEPIRKSPREFLIPIKLEASGVTVTPKEDVEIAVHSDVVGGAGSDDEFRMDSRLRSGRFGGSGHKYKRYSSLLSDSSLDEDLSASVAGSRKGSSATNEPTPVVSHGRSRSQGDEPEAATPTFKRYKVKRPDLDRSDSFSSAEEDDEDFFEVFTADSLFSNLLDRVRNLTKRINREGSIGPNWPTAIGGDAANFGLWNPSTSLRDLMARAPSETRSFGSTTPGGFTVSTHRSFSREPSGLNSTGSGPNWRRSLSRDVSGESDVSGGSGFTNPCRSYAKPLSTELFESTSVRSLPISFNRRSPSYLSQRSEPYGSDRDSVTSTPSISTTSSRQSLYAPQRPSYGRTMSNTDYASSSNSCSTPISRNLPFRRSLKTFDHHTPADYSLDSMVGAIRGLGQSLIDSPETFDPDSYLRQMRSDRAKTVGRELVINREIGPRESSVARMSSITEQDSKTPSPLPNQSFNGIGNGNTNADVVDDDGKLSVQDKMNNYTQYYQNLTSSNPLNRFQLSPSQIHADGPTRGKSPNPGSSNNSAAIGLARLRPTTMFETTTLVGNGSQQFPQNRNNAMKSEQKSGTGPVSVPPSTSAPDNSTPDTPKGSATGIPKWPGVFVQQYRPLSISSFPTTENQVNQKGSYMSQVVPPPAAPATPQSQPQSQFLNIEPPGTKKKELTSRATSVERITRFLERKSSVPREIPENANRPLSPPPQPQILNTQSPPDTSTPTTPTAANKLGKPKFLQSLERKWEKFTTPSNPNNGNKDLAPEVEKVAQPQNTNINTNSRPLSPPLASGSASQLPSPPLVPPEEKDNTSSDYISPDDNKISESVLLRRALSPEKKLKKFGSGTVNFMLGKFKRFEEETSPPPAANKFQIQPTAKPPAGTRIGRRVQSAYVGAASDSVLSLPQTQLSPPNFVGATTPPQHPSPNHSPVTIPEPSNCNGITPPQEPDTTPDNNLNMIRSAEAAQQKRRSLRLDTRSPTPCPQPETKPTSTSTPTSRPLSLSVGGGSGTNNAVFSFDPKSNSPTSLIPRPNGLVTLRCTSPPNNGNLSPLLIPPNPELITSKSMSPPQITIHSDQEQALLSPSMLSPNSVVSISDSADLDSSSVCSDRNNDLRNLSSSASVLDEEESVSDRILRKSFYSRFNSIDRAKRSVSLNAAGAARKGIYPLNNNGNHTTAALGKSSGGNLTLHQNQHHHHHHHHHRTSHANSPTPARSSPPPKTISPTPTPEPSNTNGHSARVTPTPTSTISVLDNNDAARAPSPHSLVINKYNPNPLFKELITDDFKSDIEKKTEYSRRVTSKLSKLLKEIETDLHTCALTKKDDDGNDNDDTNELGLINGQNPSNFAENEKKSKPPIGIGLKALTNNTNKNTGPTPNFKKYTGSKTTNLGGSINAISSPNNVLSKRNLFNRESSLQPEVQEGKLPPMKDRASSVSRTTTGGNTSNKVVTTNSSKGEDSMSMDR